MTGGGGARIWGMMVVMTTQDSDCKIGVDGGYDVGSDVYCVMFRDNGDKLN